MTARFLIRYWKLIEKAEQGPGSHELGTYGTWDFTGKLAG